MWHVGRHNPWHGEQKEVFPGYVAPFIRAARESTEPERELVVGQWNLIPWFAKAPKQKYTTCNARSEELAGKPTFKLPWARGQRCVVPAATFFEPNWETGQHVPWRFRRTDGEHWGLAGLWNTWTDKSTGEIHESYTLLTLNADDHPTIGAPGGRSTITRSKRVDPQRHSWPNSSCICRTVWASSIADRRLSSVHRERVPHSCHSSPVAPAASLGVTPGAVTLRQGE